MRWRTRQPGDRRTRIVFAWWPTRTDDGMSRWLERVEITEVWRDERWVVGAYLVRAHWERVSTLPANGIHVVGK